MMHNIIFVCTVHEQTKGLLEYPSRLEAGVVPEGCKSMGLGPPEFPGHHGHGAWGVLGVVVPKVQM